MRDEKLLKLKRDNVWCKVDALSWEALEVREVHLVQNIEWEILFRQQVMW